MPTARIDHVSLLEAQERHGVIIRMVRRARVIGLTNTDYQVLFSALTTAGIPAVGSRPTGTAGANLVLTERNPRIVDEDAGTVDVDLVYEHVLNQGQLVDDPPFGLVLGEVSSTVQSVKSNKDINGDLITVQHAYPADDDNFPGETRVQGGEIEYLQPQTTLTFRWIKTTAEPWLYEQYLVGSVNASAWSGRPAGEWLCTSVSWRPYDADNDKFEFTLEFQHNPDGWQPQVVFIDENTGKPPQNLIQGVGYKTITKYPSVDFENAFGVRSQGG